MNSQKYAAFFKRLVLQYRERYMLKKNINEIIDEAVRKSATSFCRHEIFVKCSVTNICETEK